MSAQLRQRCAEMTVLELERASTLDIANNVKSEYNTQVDELFKSLIRVMGLKQPKSVAGVQSFALRNYLSLLDKNRCFFVVDAENVCCFDPEI